VYVICLNHCLAAGAAAMAVNRSTAQTPSSPTRYVTLRELSTLNSHGAAVRQLFKDDSSSHDSTQLNCLLIRTGKVGLVFFFFLMIWFTAALGLLSRT